jgi:hypothetical protein
MLLVAVLVAAASTMMHERNRLYLLDARDRNVFGVALRDKMHEIETFGGKYYFDRSYSSQICHCAQSKFSYFWRGK